MPLQIAALILNETVPSVIAENKPDKWGTE